MDDTLCGQCQNCKLQLMGFSYVIGDDGTSIKVPEITLWCRPMQRDVFEQGDPQECQLFRKDE